MKLTMTFIAIGILILLAAIGIAGGVYNYYENAKYYSCVEHGFFGSPHVVGFDTFEDFDYYYETESLDRNANCYIDGRYTHKVCYYDNENSSCGKTTYCASHVVRENCLINGGTWEFETIERDMLAYPELSNYLREIK